MSLRVNMWTYSIEKEGIFENIPCHVMECFCYIHFPYGKFYVMRWNILPCHVHDFLGSTIVYWLWTWVWPTKLSNATSCEGLKTKKKDAFHHLWCKQYSKCLGFLDKNYDVFKNIEMGGNCMVEKYLMKWKPRNL